MNKTSLEIFMGEALDADPNMSNAERKGFEDRLDVITVPKKWNSSVTIWSGISSIIVGFSGLITYFTSTGGTPESLSLALAALITGVTAIYGRIRATKEIG